MRPVVRLVIAEVEGLPFMAANYYDERGQHADMVLKPVTDNVILRHTIAELMRIHEVQSVDLFTDSEDAFKAFLPAAGINVHYETKAELRDVYANLLPESPVFAMTRELWFPDKPAQDSESHEETETHRPSFMRRLIQFIKGVFTRD
ncbi:hypothetical protein [Cohnella sp.]|uniref:hypothetical protein n=1 Tax=Cohnella sp. TaxID=1883426 RepID=UPI003569E4DF